MKLFREEKGMLLKVGHHPKKQISISIGVLKGRWGNDSNLLIVFYVQIMPDDFVMQLHRF